MLPHSSGNILSLESRFEGDILSFASPSALELFGTAPTRDCDSFVGTGSSQNISSVLFQTPMIPSSILGSLFMAGRQGVMSSGRSVDTDR